jgi:hypothetical protein
LAWVEYSDNSFDTYPFCIVNDRCSQAHGSSVGIIYNVHVIVWFKWKWLIDLRRTILSRLALFVLDAIVCSEQPRLFIGDVCILFYPLSLSLSLFNMLMEQQDGGVRYSIQACRVIRNREIGQR